MSEWLKFYDKDYQHVGFLIGRYFDSYGNPTEYNHEVKRQINAAEAAKEAKQEEHDIFPPCNSEWGQKTGHRVWCTTKSGGIQREWTGVPRRYFSPGKEERCACVLDHGPPLAKQHNANGNRGDLDNPHLKEYSNCDPKSTSCQLSAPVGDAEVELDDDLTGEDLKRLHSGEL